MYFSVVASTRGILTPASALFCRIDCRNEKMFLDDTNLPPYSELPPSGHVSVSDSHAHSELPPLGHVCVTAAWFSGPPSTSGRAMSTAEAGGSVDYVPRLGFYGVSGERRVREAPRGCRRGRGLKRDKGP